MKRCIQVSCLIMLLLLIIDLTSCKHAPIFEDDITNLPIDTTMQDTTIIDPPDPMAMDTCDESLVYFDLQILPILHSNCSFSGCHDAASAEDGVILESYETVIATADVEPYDLEHSEIYEVLVEEEESKRMPPEPASRLSNEHINLIAQWILEGGKDLHCDPNLNPCSTDDVSFQGVVQPIISENCEGCHTGSTPSGGVDLGNYEAIKLVALDGRLSGTIGWQLGFKSMPQGGEQLSNCKIAQIESWINDGAPDN